MLRRRGQGLIWKSLEHDRRLKRFSPTQIFKVISFFFNNKRLKLCLHGDTFQATVYISGKSMDWITKRRLCYKLKWRGYHKTAWYLYLKGLLQYCKRRPSFWHAFYFAMKSQNISFLLRNNLEYLKILRLLVSNQESPHFLHTIPMILVQIIWYWISQ